MSAYGHLKKTKVTKQREILTRKETSQPARSPARIDPKHDIEAKMLAMTAVDPCSGESDVAVTAEQTEGRT